MGQNSDKNSDKVNYLCGKLISEMYGGKGSHIKRVKRKRSSKKVMVSYTVVENVYFFDKRTSP